MEEFKMIVPTYNGKWLEEPNCKLDDFGDPEVPVVVRPAGGLRIVLGSHEYDDTSKPDVQIERRHNGWMIFLHPLAGSDASGFVVFLDDGRSFVAKEHGYGPTDQIEMVEYEVAIAELDDVLPSGLSCAPTMVVETRPVDNNPDDHQRETISAPLVNPIATAQSSISQDVIDAIESAQEALIGDSSDDEHDALLALVEALQVCNLVEYRTYCPNWIVDDFCGWAGLDRGEPPDHEDIETYVREARPANSSPLDVNFVLHEWADSLAKKSAEPIP